MHTVPYDFVFCRPALHRRLANTTSNTISATRAWKRQKQRIGAWRCRIVSADDILVANANGKHLRAYVMEEARRVHDSIGHICDLRPSATHPSSSLRFMAYPSLFESYLCISSSQAMCNSYHFYLPIRFRSTYQLKLKSAVGLVLRPVYCTSE